MFRRLTSDTNDMCLMILEKSMRSRWNGQGKTGAGTVSKKENIRSTDYFKPEKPILGQQTLFISGQKKP